MNAAAASEQVLSREDWLMRRVDLLNEEKALSKATAALAEKRRHLGMVLVPDYRLDGPDGPTTLSLLFGESEQLIVYHLMMNDTAKMPCPTCSFFIDGFQGGIEHLLPLSAFAVVAKASYTSIQEGCSEKGWENIPMYSAKESLFGEDLGVSFTSEQDATNNRPYNYGRQWAWGQEGPGLSVFKKDMTSGAIYHTYSTYAAGLGGLSVVFSLLDLTPGGRSEENGRNMWWVKHKQQYTSHTTSK